MLCCVALAGLNGGCRGKTKANGEVGTAGGAGSAATSDHGSIVRLSVDDQVRPSLSPCQAPGALDLLDTVGLGSGNLESWGYVLATSTDRRRLTITDPHATYPGARFEVECDTADTTSTLLVRSARGEEIVALSRLESVEITSRDKAVLAAANADATVLPGLLMRSASGERKVSAEELELVPERRPVGIKQGGHAVSDIVALAGEPSAIERVVLHGVDGSYELSGNDLRDPAQHALVRRNNRGLLRFRHYTSAPSEPGAKAYATKGELRELSVIDVYRPDDAPLPPVIVSPSRGTGDGGSGGAGGGDDGREDGEGGGAGAGRGAGKRAADNDTAAHPE